MRITIRIYLDVAVFGILIGPRGEPNDSQSLIRNYEIKGVPSRMLGERMDWSEAFQGFAIWRKSRTAFSL